MLLVKVRNAGELLWDSLDGRERIMLAYGVAWLALLVTFTAQRRSRERFRQSIVDELTGARG